MKICGNIALYKGKEYKAVRIGDMFILFDGNKTFKVPNIEVDRFFYRKSKNGFYNESSDNFIEKDNYEPSTLLIYERLKKSFYGTDLFPISFPFVYNYQNEWFMAVFTWSKNNFSGKVTWMRFDLKSGRILETYDVEKSDLNDLSIYPCFINNLNHEYILKLMDYIRHILFRLNELSENDYNEYIYLILKEIKNDKDFRGIESCYS